MNNFKVSVKKVGKKSEGKQAIAFHGTLSLKNIDGIYSELSDLNFEKVSQLSIVVKDVKEIDLTFIQLLESMKKQFGEENTHIEIELAEADRMLLKKAGFDNYFVS